MAVATREAMLYEKLPNSRARCNVCQWRCIINPDRFGVCRMRQNTEGIIYTLNYAQASSVAVKSANTVSVNAVVVVVCSSSNSPF